MAEADIYSQVLMDHVAHPDYNYELEGATCSHEGINPSCGDDLRLHVRLDESGVIEEASWTGHGCAISQASADMMADLVTGATVEEARHACRTFGEMIRGEQDDEDLLEKVLDEAPASSASPACPRA